LEFLLSRTLLLNILSFDVSYHIIDHANIDRVIVSAGSVPRRKREREESETSDIIFELTIAVYLYRMENRCIALPFRICIVSHVR